MKTMMLPAFIAIGAASPPALIPLRHARTSAPILMRERASYPAARLLLAGVLAGAFWLGSHGAATPWLGA